MGQSRRYESRVKEGARGVMRTILVGAGVAALACPHNSAGCKIRPDSYKVKVTAVKLYCVVDRSLLGSYPCERRILYSD